MRKLRAIFALVLTVTIILLLDRPLGTVPALGKLLDPMNGAWNAAEPFDRNFTQDLQLQGLKGPVTVWFDDRLVPHIHATNDQDIYFVQGYIHACFRLWQMDLQTRAAAGRVSEVLGDKALNFDRTQRRKGMGYGAEQSLKAMEADPRTKQMLDAYTAGINNYISSLSYRTYPLEYKLMGFAPEPWANIKSALLLKYMADDLTGKTDDIALTALKGMYSKEEFENLFPERIKGSTTVIPAGTSFDKPSLRAPAAPADSIACIKLDSLDFETEKSDGKGSNNWALSGKRTASGAPILCNDPHLGLNLPSLWFEVQLQAPGLNVYGASLPGAPGVIIGFNENISWGFTNNYRDVKDFYAIAPSTDGKSYRFNNTDLPFVERVEKIGVKGKPDYLDTVRYTVHGPLIYEEKFPGPSGLKKPLALCWMAHRGSNELLSVYMLNRSNDYNAFVTSIQQFLCPAQNMIYADKAGNIALWGQGQFVNKWKGQGRYIMQGTDSSTLWQELIPVAENPHAFNPAQGFLSSANQTVTDSTYPYYYNGLFYEFRAWRINEVLAGMQKATVNDMFRLQNDVYSKLASQVLPVMLKYVDTPSLSAKERDQFYAMDKWNYRLEARSSEAAVFQTWWAILYEYAWMLRFDGVPDNLWPSPERTMQLLQTDTVFASFGEHYEDAEPFRDFITRTYKKSIDSLAALDGGPEWYHVKNTSVRHLTKIPAFSYSDLEIGGWGNAVNAAKGDHGPSWRMVVQMSKETEAYGVYPGGQSGNPGSRYYATFLDNWVHGRYYKLLFLPNAGKQNDKTLKYTWTVQPG